MGAGGGGKHDRPCLCLTSILVKREYFLLNWNFRYLSWLWQYQTIFFSHFSLIFASHSSICPSPQYGNILYTFFLEVRETSHFIATLQSRLSSTIFIFIHTCATCSELPSYISNMILPHQHHSDRNRDRGRDRDRDRDRDRQKQKQTFLFKSL